MRPVRMGLSRRPCFHSHGPGNDASAGSSGRASCNLVVYSCLLGGPVQTKITFTVRNCFNVFCHRSHGSNEARSLVLQPNAKGQILSLRAA